MVDVVEGIKSFFQTKGRVKLFSTVLVMMIVILVMLWLASFIYKKHKSDKIDATIPEDKKTKWTGIFFPLGFVAVLVAVLVWFWINRNNETFLMRFGDPRRILERSALT
jgi:TRAP-type C4-dicarboxylate transport system permease small subunit